MDFIHDENKIYLNDSNDHMVAVVTFPKVKDNLVTIDHTFVDNSLRGQGIAGQLMEEAVKHFREHGLTAKLSCSYAVKWFGEHPECADVVEKR